MGVHMKINLNKLGEHEIQVPSSLATCLDFISIWGSEPNRAQLGRLCASAIAVGIDHSKVLPSYPVTTGDPVKFGHKIMDRLLESGVTPGQVYEYGTMVLMEMMKAIPSEQEVEDQANFS
jgi:hypothetical protein